MIHLEKEQHIRRLNEALQSERILQNIDPSLKCNEVVEGALVQTSSGNYFIAISAGKVTIDHKDYLTVSLASPLGEEIEDARQATKYHSEARQ